MPGYAYALYDGASQWKAEGLAKSLASLGEPLFQRSAEHFTSHRQSPFDHITDYSVIATSGNVGLIGFPIGLSYYNKGYWIYRTAFDKIVQGVLPSRLIESDAPLSSEITITHQVADKEHGRKERFMVHIINWSATRSTPNHPDMYDDPIELTNIRLRLNIPLQDFSVKTVISGIDLQPDAVDNGIEVIIPRIHIHEIICFELHV